MRYGCPLCSSFRSITQNKNEVMIPTFDMLLIYPDMAMILDPKGQRSRSHGYKTHGVAFVSSMSDCMQRVESKRARAIVHHAIECSLRCHGQKVRKVWLARNCTLTCGRKQFCSFILNKIFRRYYKRFLQHVAIRMRGLCCRPVSVRPSVCHVGVFCIVYRWLKISSNCFLSR